MDSTSLVLSSLFDLLIRLPLLLVLTGGIVAAVITWRRHPQISLYTVISLVASLILTIFTTVLFKWLPSYLFGSSRLTAEQSGYVFAAIGFVIGLINAATLGLLLLAVFSRRSGNPANR